MSLFLFRKQCKYTKLNYKHNYEITIKLYTRKAYN